jgi:hypothetical protein
MESFYLFVYDLFSDTVSSVGYIASNNRLIMNNELEMMWKVASMAWYLPEGSKKLVL